MDSWPRFRLRANRLTYSTFLGGIDYDQINAIVHDSAGNLYLTGSSAGFHNPQQRERISRTLPRLA